MVCTVVEVGEGKEEGGGGGLWSDGFGGRGFFFGRDLLFSNLVLSFPLFPFPPFLNPSSLKSYVRNFCGY